MPRVKKLNKQTMLLKMMFKWDWMIYISQLEIFIYSCIHMNLVLLKATKFHNMTVKTYHEQECSSVLPRCNCKSFDPLPQMEYCSKALSWIVDTMAQGSTFKPPRPPPTLRGTYKPKHTCWNVTGCINKVYLTRNSCLQSSIPNLSLTLLCLFFYTDAFPSSSNSA